MSRFHAMFNIGGMIGASIGVLVAIRHFAPSFHFIAASVLFFPLSLFTAPLLFEAHDRAPIRIALLLVTRENKYVARTILYWVSTGLIAVMSLFAAFAYLSGSPQAVEGFTHVGYPQQLRIILGIAKPSGAIALVVPGFAKLKEWAYAGFAFAWISAFIAHYLAKDGPTAFMPLVLLLLLGISYVTRPPSRQWQPQPALGNDAQLPPSAR